MGRKIEEFSLSMHCRGYGEVATEPMRKNCFRPANEISCKRHRSVQAEVSSVAWDEVRTVADSSFTSLTAGLSRTELPIA
jgi:hypothetical protein